MAPTDSFPENVKIPRGIFNERTWTKELPFLHYAMGAIFFALAFLTNYADPDGAQHVVDFWVYYHASVIAHLSPEHLYNDNYYNYLLPHSDGQTHTYPFINPPTFLLLIYPLGYFGSRTAITLWTGMNLLLTFLLYRNISVFAQDIPSKPYRAILKSLVFGLYAWSWSIYNGQVSVILAFAISCFLLAWKQGRQHKAMFWIAFGLCIKPHYFIPVALFLFGNRNYGNMVRVVTWVMLFIALSLPIGGVEAWDDFVKQITQHGKTDMFYVMVNLRGILLLYTPRFLAGYVVALCSLLYMFTAFVALYSGYSYHKKSLAFPPETLCFWFVAAMFFCPWMHRYDFYLLLPLIVFMMPKVLHFKRQIPFLISYSMVLIDFLVPDFSIISNRITIAFTFAVAGLLLHDLRSERIPHLRPSDPISI